MHIEYYVLIGIKEALVLRSVTHHVLVSVVPVLRDMPADLARDGHLRAAVLLDRGQSNEARSAGTVESIFSRLKSQDQTASSVPYDRQQP